MPEIERPFPNANKLLDRVMDICPLPATAQRLLVLTNDERTPIDAISLAVQCDPALATQVLRVANSAAFRHAGGEPVRDLKQALVTVGLAELRIMSGAMALLATFATRDELSLDLHRTSAVSGSICEAIAPAGPGLARSLPLICGLLCEVGALACLAVDGPSYVELWRRVFSEAGNWTPDTVTMRDALETKRYGVTTRTIGARLLRRHHLPEEIATAIEAKPGASPEAPLYQRATAFARIATALVVEAAVGTTSRSVLTEQIAAVARLTSFVELQTDDLVRRCVLAAANMQRALRGVRD